MAAVSSRTVPLVNRTRELGALLDRVAAARDGRGSLVLVAGEPGIGKTRLLDAFAELASAGATILHGRCFEGDWAPPYGPWVETLAGYARSVEPEQLRQGLGPGAPALARLVPAIAAALPDLPEAGELGPEADRLRLYDAVAQLLLTIAQERPAVVVLDDLQWAGPDTLALLQYAARSIQRSRLMIVGAYRNVDLADSPGFAEALAGLVRDPGYELIALPGLSETEAAQYLAVRAEREVSGELAQAIHAETDGNPFFMGELLRSLVEQRRVVERDGRWAGGAGLGELSIPDSVQQVVSSRLARLGADTRRALTVAAAFGGSFDFRVLQAITGLPEDALLDAIDEALLHGLIREADGKADAYEFVHAILRRVVQAELNASRRTRLHLRIAEALEQLYAGREQEHAAELAAQYHAATGLPGSERGFSYALIAAEQAQAVYAHERAVAFLRMARDLASEREAAVRVDLLCRLAIAQAEAFLPGPARDTVDQALVALDEAGATPGAVAQFLVTAAARLKDGGAGNSVWQPLVERGLALMGDQHDLVWARLMLVLEPIEPLSSGGISAGRWLGYDPQAVAIARSEGGEEDYAATLYVFDWTTRSETEAIVDLAGTWQSPAARMRARWTMEQKLIMWHGAMREAGADAEGLLEAGQRLGSIIQQVQALAALVSVHAALGAFAEARDALARSEQLLVRLGPDHWLRLMPAPTFFILDYYLDGDWPAQVAVARGASEHTPHLWLPIAPALHGQGALACVRAGQTDGVDETLAALTPLLEGLKPTAFSVNGGVGYAAAAIWELGSAALAPRYRRLALAQIAAGVGGSPATSNELTVARMAALTGDLAEAEAYFARARGILDANGQLPLRAIVDYDEALALVRTGSRDRDRIVGLLDAALAEFDAMGMEGWAGRARDQREVAEAGRHAPRYPHDLTEREVEVLRLIAAGKSNHEIAEALTLSVYTVQNHLANVYAKIGARHRVDATTYAVRHGLIGE